MKSLPFYFNNNHLPIPQYLYGLIQYLFLRLIYYTNEHLPNVHIPFSFFHTFPRPSFKIQFFHIFPLQSQISFLHYLHLSYPYKILNLVRLILYQGIYTNHNPNPIIIFSILLFYYLSSRIYNS